MKLLALILLFPALVIAQSPKTATARPLGPAPGAIVCQDMATVQFMFHWYAQSWEEHMQDAVTRGGSTAIRGRALAGPDLKRFGCALAKPGTLLHLLGGNWVSFKEPSGKVFKGVTQSNMYAIEAEKN